MLAYAVQTANARLAAALIDRVPGQSVDGGSGAGTLVIGTAALSGDAGVLARVEFMKPSFTIADGVATLIGSPLLALPTDEGIVARAELRDSEGRVILSGLTATDIVVDWGQVNFGERLEVSLKIKEELCRREGLTGRGPRRAGPGVSRPSLAKGLFI